MKAYLIIHSFYMILDYIPHSDHFFIQKNKIPDSQLWFFFLSPKLSSLCSIIRKLDRLEALTALVCVHELTYCSITLLTASANKQLTTSVLVNLTTCKLSREGTRTARHVGQNPDRIALKWQRYPLSQHAAPILQVSAKCWKCNRTNNRWTKITKPI